MKAIFLALALLLTVLQMVGQDTSRSPVLTKADYLRKSKSNTTAGWILLGSGIGLAIASGATLDISSAIFPGQSHVDNTASIILGVGAAGAILGSIISFSDASKNKRKAASVSISNERIRVGQHNTLVVNTQPTLHLKIPL